MCQDSTERCYFDARSPHFQRPARTRNGDNTDDQHMNMKRMRGRNNRGGGGGGGGPIRHNSGGNIPMNRNHVFDSQGPDLRLRGTAQQLFEKYLQLGRDATSGGDRVSAEGYFQHAEHYFRIMGAMQAVQQQNGQGGVPNPNAQYRRPQGMHDGQQYSDDDMDGEPRRARGNSPPARCGTYRSPRRLPTPDPPSIPAGEPVAVLPMPHAGAPSRRRGSCRCAGTGRSAPSSH